MHLFLPVLRMALLPLRLFFLRQVIPLRHLVIGITEPLIFVSCFRERTAVLQISHEIRPDNGCHPLRASEFPDDLLLPLRACLFQIIPVILKRLFLVLLRHILEQVLKTFKKLFLSHILASSKIWDIFAE